MESSNWYYYVGDYMNNPAAMQLPAIKLDAPAAKLDNVTVTHAAQLYDSGSYERPMGDPISLDITHFAVQWKAANRYPSIGELAGGMVRNLTDHYKFTVTAKDGGENYTIEMWTYDADSEEKKDDGTPEHLRGEIKTVKKTVTIDGNNYEKYLDPQIEKDADGNVTRTWYDLSLTPATKDGGSRDTNNWVSQPVSLRGRITQKDSDAQPYYEVADAIATLQVVDDDGEPAYRVTLPDMQDILTTGDKLHSFTDSILVETLVHSSGDGKTVGTPDAEAVKIGDETQTVELIAEEPTPDENTETTQPTETPAEPQNAPQPVELTDKAG